MMLGLSVGSRARKGVMARPMSVVSMLAMTTIQTKLKTTSRWCVSISGPGTMPRPMKATSSIAMASPPGMPKASVGSRPPPSLAPSVASGAITPSMAPLPKRSGVFEVCTACA